MPLMTEFLVIAGSLVSLLGLSVATVTLLNHSYRRK